MDWKRMCEPEEGPVCKVKLTHEEIFAGALAAHKACQDPEQENSAGYDPDPCKNILNCQAGFWAQMAVARWLKIPSYTPGVFEYKKKADVAKGIEVRWATYKGLTLRPYDHRKKKPGDSRILYRDFVLVTGIYDRKNSDDQKGMYYSPDSTLYIWGWLKGWEVFGQRRYLAKPDPRRDYCYVCPADKLERKKLPMVLN